MSDAITYKNLMMQRVGVYVGGRKVGEIRKIPHPHLRIVFVYVPTGQAAGTCEPFRSLEGCKASLGAAP